MSSYETSPYVLEEQRLAGIVNACKSHLSQVIAEMEYQRKHMLEVERGFRENDKKYANNESVAKERVTETIKNIESFREKKRYEIQDELHRIKLELQGFGIERGGYSEVFNELEKAEYLSADADCDLEYLERIVSQQKKKLKMFFNISENANELDKENLRFNGQVSSQRAEKGISLTLSNDIKSQNKSVESKPIDLFSEQLLYIMQSEFSDKFPSVLRIKKEFDDTPDYSKKIYVLEHMEELEKHYIRLRKMEEHATGEKDLRDEWIKEYDGLCKILHIEPNEDICGKEVNIHTIKEICEELFDTYVGKSTQKYVVEALKIVMSRYGIEFQSDSSSDNMAHAQFRMENANIDVYGSDYSQLNIQVSGSYTGDAPTVDETRKSANSAIHFCDKMKLIEEELKNDFGICFNRNVLEEPTEDNIIMKKNLKHNNKHFSNLKTESIG